MPVPKFSSKEEYEQWKADRLANPQPVSQQQSSSQYSQSDHDDPELEPSLKRIKSAWTAGIVSGIVTLIITVIAMNGNDVLGLGYSAYNFLDVLFIFALSFGIYQKSRTSALLMFLYFVGSKILIWAQMGKLAGLPGAVIFGYFFLQGIIGTFEYRSFKARDGNTAVWRPISITAAFGVIMVVLFFGKNFGLNIDMGSVTSSAPSVAAVDWKDFSSTEGGFAILMPGEPAQSTETVKTAAGDMSMHIYMLELKNSAYGVIYTDMPSMFQQMPNAADKLLDGGRDGAVAQMKGKLVSEQAISIGRHPGRELHIDSDRAVIVARIFLVDLRLYQVLAILPKGQSPTDDTTKFLDSFRAAI